VSFRVSAIFVWCAFQPTRRCIVVLSSRVDLCGYYLARPCACPPLPWFSWAPRHLLPHRGQAGPHLSDDLSFRCIYRPHRREDPPVVVPWHAHPGALHYGHRDLALEERARQCIIAMTILSMSPLPSAQTVAPDIPSRYVSATHIMLHVSNALLTRIINPLATQLSPSMEHFTMMAVGSSTALLHLSRYTLLTL
jgi:hypothetical protein